KYVLSGEIRSGGFGTIYTGYALRDLSPVAFKKIMKTNVTQWEDSDCRMPKEIAIMQRLQYVPHIIQLLDWHEDDEAFLIVMEQPDPCKDLFEYITDRGFLPENEARVLFTQALVTFMQMYGKYVYHRDIKSENILTTTDSSGNIILKFIDFGAANYVSEEPFKRSDGTILYSPPETFSGHRYNGYPEAIWSLGILLYELTSGCLPFENEQEIRLGNYSFDNSLHLSNPLKKLISSLLDPDPNKRPDYDQILFHPWMISQENDCEEASSIMASGFSSDLTSRYIKQL
ncbi:UNVERIFIED_CONTAM: hypothetical protein GTU68_024933, partial [Idotea baltica]|nr:hypothetical protein [Idotea baltica]